MQGSVKIINFIFRSYLTVDYERANFSISPVMFSDTSDLVAILPVGYSPAQGLSAGAIAGIVVGIVVTLSVLAFTAWFFVRKRRKAADVKAKADAARAAATSASLAVDAKDSPQMGFKPELPADNAVQPKELESPEVRTLSPSPSELAGSPKLPASPGQPSELGSDRVTSWDSRTVGAIHELPAEDVAAAELPSSRLSVQGLGLVHLQNGR